jgi:hypothetical protein
LPGGNDECNRKFVTNGNDSSNCRSVEDFEKCSQISKNLEEVGPLAHKVYTTLSNRPPTSTKKISQHRRREEARNEDDEEAGEEAQQQREWNSHGAIDASVGYDYELIPGRKPSGQD